MAIKYLDNCSTRYLSVLKSLGVGLDLSEYDYNSLTDLGQDVFHVANSDTSVRTKFIIWLDEAIEFYNKYSSVVQPSDEKYSTLENDYIEALTTFIDTYNRAYDDLDSKMTELIQLMEDNSHTELRKDDYLVYIDIHILRNLMNYAKSANKLYAILVYLDSLFHENSEPTVDATILDDESNKLDIDFGKFIFQTPQDLPKNFIPRLNQIKSDSDSNAIIVVIRGIWMNFIDTYGKTTHANVIVSYLYYYLIDILVPNVRVFTEDRINYLRSMINKILVNDNPNPAKDDNYTYNDLVTIQSNILSDEYLEELKELFGNTISTINDAAQNLPTVNDFNSNEDSAYTTVDYPTEIGNITREMLMPSLDKLNENYPSEDGYTLTDEFPRIRTSDATIYVNRLDLDNFNSGNLYENLFDQIIDTINVVDCLKNTNNSISKCMTDVDLEELSEWVSTLYQQLLNEEITYDEFMFSLESRVDDIKLLISTVDELLDNSSECTSGSEDISANYTSLNKSTTHLQNPDLKFVNSYSDLTSVAYSQQTNVTNNVDTQLELLDKLVTFLSPIANILKNVATLSQSASSLSTDDILQRVGIDWNSINSSLQALLDKIKGYICSINNLACIFVEVKAKLTDLLNSIDSVKEWIGNLTTQLSNLIDLADTAMGKAYDMLDDAVLAYEKLSTANGLKDLKDKLLSAVGSEISELADTVLSSILGNCNASGDNSLLNGFVGSAICNLIGSTDGDAKSKFGLSSSSTCHPKSSGSVNLPEIPNISTPSLKLDVPSLDVKLTSC